MELREYAFQLGSLMANFQSLEFALRAFLQQLPSARPLGIKWGQDLYSFPVGCELAESEITSYDSLGQLIDKFNLEALRRNQPQIDRTLVDVRDALAHGRVSADITSDALRLLRFEKPKNGRVRVMFNHELSAQWFSSQKQRVCGALLQFAPKPDAKVHI